MTPLIKGCGGVCEKCTFVDKWRFGLVPKSKCLPFSQYQKTDDVFYEWPQIGRVGKQTIQIGYWLNISSTNYHGAWT